MFKHGTYGLYTETESRMRQTLRTLFYLSSTVVVLITEAFLRKT